VPFYYAEDGLIDIGNAGIIYVPGGAGTRQEVFQAACKNHYADQGEEIPMLFWGKDFWESSGIFHALEKNSRGRPMHNWLRLTDSVEDIVTAMKDYATKTHLPLVSIADLEQEHTEVYAHALKEKVRCEKDRKRKREEIASRNRTAHRRRSQDVPLALLALL
jgi:predicted Rossmann-fold nucleotide-binding protein